MNKNSNIKILKDANTIENFVGYTNNQLGCNAQVDINTDIIDITVNQNSTANISNRFTQCNQLPNATLRRLCAFRSDNDTRYANWIATGRAWWFTCYPSNRRVAMGFGWEADPVKYPLPTWWWRYPEIPAPSIEWLSQSFQLNGEIVRRRNYYMPRPGINIPRRVDLRNYNQNCNNVDDNVEEVDININDLFNSNGTVSVNETVTVTDLNAYNNTYLYNNNIVGVQDYPVNTREGFDNMNMDGANQSYIILFLVIIVIFIIFLFAYNRSK